MFEKTTKHDQATNPGNSSTASAKPTANGVATPPQAPRLPAYVMHA